MTNRNFAMDDMTHRRLKSYAAFEGVSIGNAIGKLLNLTAFKVVPEGASYATWLANLLEIGKQYGEEAAQRYLKLYPYKG